MKRYLTTLLVRLFSFRPLENVKLIILREGRSGLRELSLSGQTLYRAAWGLIFLFPLVIYLGAQLLLETVHSNRVAKLRQDNQELLQQVEKFETRITTLEQSLSVLSNLDQDLRTHANIAQIPGEIRQVGIGGGMLEWAANYDYLLPSDDVSVAELSQRVDVLQRALKLEQLSYEDLRDELKDDLARLRNTPSIPPIGKGYTGSGYGLRRHPYTNVIEQHRGLDITAKSGTPVRATADGRIIATRFDRNLGIYIKIDHGNGFQTLYGHLREIGDIDQGQWVKRGAIIGYSGNSGRSTAPHLHYEVRHYNQPQNPINYY